MAAPHPAQLHPLVPLPAELRALLDAHGSESHEAPTDRLVSAFAQAQHGAVSRRQLLAAGVAPAAITRRIARGQLVQRYRGVYAPGHLHLDRHGHRTATTLAVPNALLTHGSSTELHGCGGGGGRWHVTVAGNGGRRSTPRIVIHTSTTIRPRDVTVVAGLPTTTLARAIVDAASHLRPKQMANVLARAERASLLDIAEVHEVMRGVRYRPTAAHALLTAAVGEHIRLGAQLTRSDVEGALRDIAVAAGIPPPRLNRMVGGDEVDALWPEFRLGIEVDSWEFHRDRRSFVADRAKLRRLYLQGLTVLPFAASDIVHRPGEVADQLRALLARSRPA